MLNAKPMDDGRGAVVQVIHGRCDLWQHRGKHTYTYVMKEAPHTSYHNFTVG